MQIRKIFFLIIFISIILIALNMQSVLAHPPHHEEIKKFKEQYEQLNDEKKKEVNKIMTTLHKDLKELGVYVPPMHFIQLEEKKEKLKKLIRDVDTGKLSVSEAEKQIDDMWSFKKDHRHRIFEGLDAQSKKNAKDIWYQMKQGEITEDVAKKQLEAIGVKLPEEKKLDHKTKEKAKKLITDAKKKLEKYKIDLPVDLYEHALK